MLRDINTMFFCRRLNLNLSAPCYCCQKNIVDNYSNFDFLDGEHNIRRFFVEDKNTQSSKNSGLVYVLSNTANTACKIGFTQKSSNSRLKNYKKRKNLFGRWHVFAQYKHKEAKLLEKKAHKHFIDYRITGEVFSVDPQSVCDWLSKLGATYISLDTSAA